MQKEQEVRGYPSGFNHVSVITNQQRQSVITFTWWAVSCSEEGSEEDYYL